MTQAAGKPPQATAPDYACPNGLVILCALVARGSLVAVGAPPGAGASVFVAFLPKHRGAEAFHRFAATFHLDAESSAS